MKYRQPKLSSKQCEMLMVYAANNNLSIDQIAWAKSYSPKLLSRLVNSAKGQQFLEGAHQMPPSLIDEYRMVGANLMPELIIPGVTPRQRQSR